MNANRREAEAELEEMGTKERRFSAQTQYAESIFRSSIGDIDASIGALERALEIDSEYAPAILSMGSVEYQREKSGRGKELFLSLVSLPPNAAEEGEDDLVKIIDEAGDFLIQIGNYSDGLELYRAAVARFPDRAVFHQGLCCCAGHEGLPDEAIEASQLALQLDPDNQEYVNDLGWSLFEAGRLDEAQQVLNRAVAMNPADKLACENLRLCNMAISEGRSET
jgi:tetratricopeptide (TPR) repeat protein